MDIISPIVDIMVITLKAINGLTHNYGVTLIVFAAMIKLVTYGFTQQMYETQKKMEQIKPLQDAIRERFKDDPQKVQEETMKLYKEVGLNPLAGCLPMLIQMPILFSIWRAIMSQPEEFGSAYFLWIHPGALQSIIPGYFASCLADPDVALMIFYAAMMLLSQQLTPTAGDPTQKKIGLYMSAIFTYMIWQAKWPCALVLYWSSFQFFSVLQQMLIARTPPKPASP